MSSLPEKSDGRFCGADQRLSLLARNLIAQKEQQVSEGVQWVVDLVSQYSRHAPSHCKSLDLDHLLCLEAANCCKCDLPGNRPEELRLLGEKSIPLAPERKSASQASPGKDGLTQVATNPKLSEYVAHLIVMLLHALEVCFLLGFGDGPGNCLSELQMRT